MGIEMGKLKGLDAAFGRVLEQFPERRRELHERVGEAVHRELQQQISTSVNDVHGKIRRWQILHVGSGGGYAAIRAMGSAQRASTGRESPGAITNYLENGHRIRPAGKSKGRVKKPFVNGYHFYADTAARAEGIAIAEAEAWADELVAALEESL